MVKSLAFFERMSDLLIFLQKTSDSFRKLMREFPTLYFVHPYQGKHCLKNNLNVCTKTCLSSSGGPSSLFFCSRHCDMRHFLNLCATAPLPLFSANISTPSHYRHGGTAPLNFSATMPHFRGKNLRHQKLSHVFYLLSLISCLLS